MICWCDNCDHNRDFECQLGANVEIELDYCPLCGARMGGDSE